MGARNNKIIKYIKGIGLKQTLRFTLIELILVLVIVTISFTGFTTMTSVGIDVGSNAVAKGITTDAAEQFLRFNAKLIRNDWNWLDMFPDSRSTDDDSVISDQSVLQWSQTTLVENDIMKIRFVTEDPDEPFDAELHMRHKDERSVYLYEQLASAYSKYGVSLRPWKEIKNLGNGSLEATLHVEASYPARMPYESRIKEMYSLSFYKAPEIALAHPNRHLNVHQHVN